jgi:hypothetical protein
MAAGGEGELAAVNEIGREVAGSDAWNGGERRGRGASPHADLAARH